ncbi:MAG: hypothetical protein K0S33_1794 [Bacteroidetes bacterium]|jgi:RNA polymerase sigma factor (sigma-70 family)|nr:hypothetical protein [Bacteroidota bacterium]
MTTLLKEIRKKDKKALQLIYDCYGKKLYGYAVSKWKLEEDEAWDVIYQTLYRTIDVIDKYTFADEKKFAGFIFTVFTNNLRNHYNKKKNTNTQTVELLDGHGSIAQDPPATETETDKESIHMHCLQKGLADMDDWKRIVLLMRAQDHSYEEIANYVKKPVEQLKVYYMRLKKILTEKINECLSKNSE